MSRTRPLRDAALALSLLTLIPTGVRWPDGERTGVAGWFVPVGLLIGAASLAFARLLSSTGVSSGQPLLAAAMLVVMLALLTRFLHYDGVADVADAWWGGTTPTRRLEIMSDSATGAFGATTIALVVVLQVAAVAGLLQSPFVSALLVAPALARLAATCAAWLGEPARDSGLGRSVMGRPDVVSVAVTLAALAVCTFVVWDSTGRVGLGWMAVGLILALVVPHLISRRMGGVTGDVMGASVLLVETVLYVAAALMKGVVG